MNVLGAVAAGLLLDLDGRSRGDRGWKRARCFEPIDEGSRSPWWSTTHTPTRS
jgi:hypothetical protein